MFQIISTISTLFHWYNLYLIPTSAAVNFHTFCRCVIPQWRTPHTAQTCVYVWHFIGTEKKHKKTYQSAAKFSIRSLHAVGAFLIFSNVKFQVINENFELMIWKSIQIQVHDGKTVVETDFYQIFRSYFDHWSEFNFEVHLQSKPQSVYKLIVSSLPPTSSIRIYSS